MSFYIEASRPVTAAPVAAGPNVVLYSVPCDSTVIVTDAVKMVGGVAFKATADSVANSNVIGIVQKKITPTLCDIRVSGVTPSIFSGLDESEEYVLSATTSGEVIKQSVATYSTGNIVLRVGQPYSATELLVIKGVRIIKA